MIEAVSDVLLAEWRKRTSITPLRTIGDLCWVIFPREKFHFSIISCSKERGLGRRCLSITRIPFWIRCWCVWGSTLMIDDIRMYRKLPLAYYVLIRLRLVNENRWMFWEARASEPWSIHRLRFALRHPHVIVSQDGFPIEMKFSSDDRFYGVAGGIRMNVSSGSS